MAVGRRSLLGAALAAPALAFGTKYVGAMDALDQPLGRVLVAYYSRTGHTRIVAEMIQRRIGGDLLAIETVEPYPDDYDELVAQNVREQQANFLPPLKTHLDVGRYDTVFIGSPLWNVRLTPPVRSFVASHDLAGKAMAPFVTYIVSHLGRSHDDVAELAPQARLLTGLAVLGEDAGIADDAVARWLSSIQKHRRRRNEEENTRSQRARSFGHRPRLHGDERLDGAADGSRRGNQAHPSGR